MIGLKVRTEFDAKPIEAATERAQFKNFGHAAARVSKDAKASLEKAEGPSAPGQPPHTHRGAYLRRAIRFDANKDGAVIGPMHSIVADAGAAHEFGGEFRDADFPERPFMAPALDQNLDRFASDWAGSIGE